jgi:hypothetical protein
MERRGVGTGFIYPESLSFFVFHRVLPSCIRLLASPTFHPHMPTHYLSLCFGILTSRSCLPSFHLTGVVHVLSIPILNLEPYFLLALILSFVVIDREDTATTIESNIPSGLLPTPIRIRLCICVRTCLTEFDL